MSSSCSRPGTWLQRFLALRTGLGALANSLVGVGGSVRSRAHVGNDVLDVLRENHLARRLLEIAQVLLLHCSTYRAPQSRVRMQHDDVT